MFKKNEITGIDVHAHVFTTNLRYIPHRRYTPSYNATAIDFFNCLDSIGFSHGVLVQPSFLGTDNSYLLSTLQSSSGRLKGIAVIGPEHSMTELESMAAMGVTGIRLNCIGKENPHSRDKSFIKMMEKVASLGWHVEIHQNGLLVRELVQNLLPYGIEIVIDHFGRPDMTFPADMLKLKQILTLSEKENVMIKASGLYRLWHRHENDRTNAERLMNIFIKNFSKERIMIGSDWPHTQFESQVSYNGVMNELISFASENNIKEYVCIKNAQRLYGF
ncbi:MAG: amidohydrolase family protein [Pantoea sp. Morm]|uniref:amidohydrolase family protein n=1 Tax=Pantoea sp. Morm TaxID=2601250 RepID=UPI001DE3B4D3|nr:amidohydrolase family protein [Pantoea sp. Morm]